MKKGHYLSIECRDGKIERVFCPVHAPSLFEETCSLQEKNVSWDRLNYIDHRCFWPISWPYYLRFVQLIYYNQFVAENFMRCIFRYYGHLSDYVKDVFGLKM